MKNYDRRVRVQVFSGSTSQYRQFELSWRRFILLGLFLGLGLALLVTGGFWLFSELYQEVKTKPFSYNGLELNREDKAKPAIQQVSGEVDPEYNAKTDLPQLFSANAGTENEVSPPVLDEDDEFFLSYSSEDRAADSVGISSMISDLELRLDEAMRLRDEITDKFDSDEALKYLPSIMPLRDGRITDLYGKRKDPILKRTRHHNGIDIAAPRGTPVYAPAAGVVEIAHNRYRLNHGYGRVVRINHGKGIKTLYGHLHKIFVKPGQKVKRWQVIGLVGTTGRSTGPHLHYEIYVNGKAIDPFDKILN